MPCSYVLQELSFLEEDAAVYKLVGPVLLKQDLAESKSNVEKRIAFIKGQLYVLPCRSMC